MILSKLGASLIRSSRYRNVINGASKRRYFWNKDKLGAPTLDALNGYANEFDGKLEFLRGYIAAVGGSKRSISGNSLSDFKFFAANPRITRYFCSESPKKKEEGSERDEIDIIIIGTAMLLLLILAMDIVLAPDEVKQISFQEFKTTLLEPGLVDHIVITNKSVAKVYVRSSPPSASEASESESSVRGTLTRAGKSQCKYYLNIGSVETFKEELEKAQEALGIDPHDYVPVTYNEVASTLLQGQAQTQPQYYQQYAGYNPYQQHQQYYSLQQQPFQQYQQHQVQVQGQQQSNAYSQAVVQPQSQPQGQAQQHLQPQPLQQPHLVHQTPPQPPQMHAQGKAQTQPQVQFTPQGKAQANAPMQNYQVNPQQPLHPGMRPQTQIPQQVLPPPPPPSQSTQPSHHPQTIGVRPPAQHQQMPQYQQPQGQMHHSQASQAHMQPQMHPQAQPYTQSSNQLNAEIQPQSQPYQSQSQPQANHSASSGTLPQAPQPSVTPVSGHQSYQPPPPAQNMQPGALQQHPAQAHGQVPQQPALMRPSQSHGAVSQQPSTLLPPQSKVPGVPVQFHPPMQPVQQIKK